MSSSRPGTEMNKSERYNVKATQYDSKLTLNKSSTSYMSASQSLNKFKKCRERQINEENQKLLKKIQNVKPTP